MAEILYRKWRPRTFAELSGQEHIATTLTNALAGRRIAHAYLFCGPRGTGKTSTGRLLGKALNCTDRQDGEPCNRCESCQAFLAGRAVDLIELDAASNRGIDEIRSLRDKVAFAPGAGEYKVYLIDEVHMLTEAAFNALLKTLEEPPPHVVFILATTEAHKLPATITSRCQRFDFRRIPLAAAVRRLTEICGAEGIACEAAALELIARSGTGSMRDAINLLDQLATSYGNDLTVEHVRAGLGLIGDERAGRLARLALAGDLGGGLSVIASVRDDGLDLRQFQRELVDELRSLLLVKSGLEPPEGASEEALAEAREAVRDVATTRLIAALKAFGEADLKTDPNSTLPLDIALADCILSQAATGAPAPPAEPARAAPHVAQRPAAAPERAVPPRPSAPSLAATGEQAAADALPAAAAAPAPGGNGSTVEPNLAAARNALRQIQDRARAQRIQVGALLNSVCDIIEVDVDSLTFGFKFAAQVDLIADPKNLGVLTDAVSAVLGRSVTVRCRHEPNVEDWKQRESASRSPLVRAAQEMGARIVSAQPEEPA